MQHKAFALVAIALSIGVALSLTDLYRIQQGTLVVYTTPALRDLLESYIVPEFRAQTGIGVTLVYVSAGEQYTRLQMSSGHPEADVFLHASPLFLEKGNASGYFLPYKINGNATFPANFTSRNGTGGHTWYAFAWSPLVEVFTPVLGSAPDLAFLNTSFGFPHPLLSNNGIYSVLLFENVSVAAGARALAHTVVQPANARANILGIADAAFKVTLGYEAVTLYYINQGARVDFNLPVIGGMRYMTPVIFAAGLVKGHPHPGAFNFIEFLFHPEIQSNLSRFYCRSVYAGSPNPVGGVQLPSPGVITLNYDWSQWHSLELALPGYVIGG